MRFQLIYHHLSPAVFPGTSHDTNQCYGLHDSAYISVHSASVTVLGLLKKKKKELVQNGVFAVFRLAT